MEEICRECKEQKIANVTNFRNYIDLKITDKNKAKHIKGRLRILNEKCFVLLKLEQNFSNQVQHINDKNSYILSPNKHLETHVNNVKKNITKADERFSYMQDAAFIMLDFV